MGRRETIMEALLARFQSIAGTGIGTYTRRWLAWIDDPNATQPALPLLVQWETPLGEHYVREPGSGLPANRTMEVVLLLYAKIPAGSTPGVKDGTTAGATVINDLLDLIEPAFEPDDAQSGRLTLGGLVVDCCINGEIAKVAGDGDPSALCSAIVPVKILVQ